MDGMQFLDQALAPDPGIHVLILSASYSPLVAMDALKRGACDYLVKPLDFARLAKLLDEIVELYAIRTHVRELEDRLLPHLGFHGMFGKTPAMLEVFDLARKAARLSTNILISGPPGSGKELLARAIHQMSAANGTSFAFCHCADSDDTSLGAGIFGQPGGPCAGPATRASAFDYPGSGTVFLDEVRDLSLPMQSQLLRALQEFDVRHPTGMDVRKDSKKGDVRFVVATSGDLRTELASGAFREDLLLRLNPIEIHVPALAQRAGDTPILIRHFLRMYGHADGKNLRGLTRRAQIALFDHDWSGNVGELESVISDAAAAASGEFIDLGDLSPDLTAEVRQPVSPSPTLAEVVWQPLPLAEVRRIHIQQVLVACKGNRVRAAQTLGIGRTSLYRYMKRASLAKGDAASASAPS